MEGILTEPEVINLREIVNDNTYKRAVICTTIDQQITVNFLSENQVIEMERHRATQTVMVQEGQLAVMIRKGKFLERLIVEENQIIVIPPYVHHRVKAVVDTKFFVIYSPPAHDPNEVE